MKDYDSRQLLEDFEYLQYLGKCVTMVGKDIVQNGWLKDAEQQESGGRGSGMHNQHSNNASGESVRGGPPNKNFHQHISAELKNRRTLESWIRKLRLPIMLVPEGMSLRKENQTRWKNNMKQLLCTVEIRSVTSSAPLNKQRSLLHHISWDKQISDVVIKEIDKKMKHKGKASVDVPIDEFNHMKGISIDNWRDSLSIAISVSNERLRNESSSKFLDWWQRQVKNGMVKADGLEFDEEKKVALEQLRKGVWAAVEGIEGQWPDIATESKEHGIQDEGPPKPSTTGLISSSLLEKMQAARAARNQFKSEKQFEQELKDNSSTFGPRRTVILLKGTETFQDILQSLPKGIAIVEYFHVEVWAKKTLLMEIQKGNIVREMLLARSESEEDSKEKLRKRDREDQAIDTISPSKKAKGGTTSNALGTLTAYESSDEEKEDDQEAANIDEDTYSEKMTTETKAPVLSSLAEMARSLGMVPSI